MLITKKYFRSLLLLIMLSCMIGITEAKAQNDKKVNEDQKSLELHQVEAKYICMINNKLFKEKQIPVPIDGKTYYGCCQGCVKKLNEDPESRFAIDPVSENRVNKAKAVFGVTPDSTVYYFESIANMKKFEPESDPSKKSDGK